MNVLLKWILITVAVIALLLVITAVVLPLTLDPNNYKPEISQAVKEKTGRDLTINGDIGWTVFPWLGLEVNDVTLGNREGFGNDPMLVIGQAGASVKIMPLFSKKVEIGKVSLADMSVNLRQKANGENNWDDLSDSSVDGTNSSTNSDNADIQSIQISGIEVKNANVIWNDAGQITELKRFNLQASGIADAKPFSLTGDFAVALLDPIVEGEISFSTQVIPAEQDGGLQLKDLNFDFNGQHGAAPDKVRVSMEIATDVVVNEAQDSARLDDFQLRLHEMLVTGNLVVSSLSTDPVATGAVKVAGFDPKGLLKSLDTSAPVTSNPDALTHFSAEMNFTGSANGTDWRDLKMKLDQSTLSGHFKVDNFERPRLDFNLAIDSINLDDYMPPADATGTASAAENAVGSQNSQQGGSTSQPQGTAESDLTSETFRGLSGGGKFQIAQLTIAGLNATDVSTTMTANKSGWRFYPTVANFYGGKNETDIRIDASGSRPVLNMTENLSGVQAEGLLADLTGKASRLLGTGTLQLKIQTDLSNSASIRNQLNGDLSMNVADGAFIGIDVADTISQAKSLLGKSEDSTEQLDNDAQTEFALLGMTGLIRNGILSSDDFDMSSTLLRASGKGQINLVNETIDYVVKPVLSENVRGEGKSTLGKLSGIPIPIKISGSLYDPKISIDFVGAVTESQKARIDEKKTELTNKLFDKLLGGDKEKDKKKKRDREVETPPD